jgi:predicted nucleotide-binding protein (sugar kinase/HSP70/actin superfamily)
MGSSALDKVTWEGNSKQMYRAILEVIPFMFKSTIKHEVNAWLVKNGVKVITEELIIRMFKEKAPKPMWQKVGPKLEGMKTDK